MWNDLPVEEKKEYKKMILAFAALTEMFAQKAEEDTDRALMPIVTSKYQETVFGKVFGSTSEDIRNTPYDASLQQISHTGERKRYLIGIKTFGYNSGSQKVAQFKTNMSEWAEIVTQINNNAEMASSKSEIDAVNQSLYMDLARSISLLRNHRIASAETNLRGFSSSGSRDDIESVYHVLMPAVEDNTPVIHVGETTYDSIDIDNIEIRGCTQKSSPANFVFSDGRHEYHFTVADSQLWMNFDTKNIVKETWNVIYADDAYAIFSELGDRILGPDGTDGTPGGPDDTPGGPDGTGESIIDKSPIAESYSWTIARNGEVELFSGFNSFYGVGSKLGQTQRTDAINNLGNQYSEEISPQVLTDVLSGLREFLLSSARTQEEKMDKVNLRNKMMILARNTGNADFEKAVAKLVYRPSNELYIPIPNSKMFHYNHPDFFCKSLGEFKETYNGVELKLNVDKEQREFNLIFEPSGDSLRAYIVQDAGKAIESVEKQTYLGEWILRGIFQLKEYEPLTLVKMEEVGINGIRLFKLKDSDDIHLQFIWIDDDNLPDDYEE